MEDDVYIFNKSMIPDVGKPDAPSTQIDDASPENLKRLKNFFEEILEENKEKFDTVCDLLVTNRDRKQGSEIGFFGEIKRQLHFLPAKKT